MQCDQTFKLRSIKILTKRLDVVSFTSSLKTIPNLKTFTALFIFFRLPYLFAQKITVEQKKRG